MGVTAKGETAEMVSDKKKGQGIKKPKGSAKVRRGRSLSDEKDSRTAFISASKGGGGKGGASCTSTGVGGGQPNKTRKHYPKTGND